MRIPLPTLARMLVVAMALSWSLGIPWRVQAQAYDPSTGGPPPGSHLHYTRNTWALVPTREGEGISGKIILDCFSDDLDEVHVAGKGFKTTGIYTVWLIRKDGPDTVTRAYIGSGWQGKPAETYWFEARSDGQGNYHGCMRSCPLGKWRALEIRYHPGGKAADLQTSVPVARVSLKGQ